MYVYAYLERKCGEEREGGREGVREGGREGRRSIVLEGERGRERERERESSSLLILHASSASTEARAYATRAPSDKQAGGRATDFFAAASSSHACPFKTDAQLHAHPRHAIFHAVVYHRIRSAGSMGGAVRNSHQWRKQEFQLRLSFSLACV